MNPLPSQPQSEPVRLWPGADDLLAVVLSGGLCLCLVIRRGWLRGSVSACLVSAYDRRAAQLTAFKAGLKRTHGPDRDTLDVMTDLVRARLCRTHRQTFFSGQVETDGGSLLWDIRFEPLFRKDRMLFARAGGRIFLNGEEFLLPQGSGLMCVHALNGEKNGAHYGVLCPDGPAPLCLSGRQAGPGALMRDGLMTALDVPLIGPGTLSFGAAGGLGFDPEAQEAVLRCANGTSVLLRYGRLRGRIMGAETAGTGFIIYLK